VGKRSSGINAVVPITARSESTSHRAPSRVPSRRVAIIGTSPRLEPHSPSLASASTPAAERNAVIRSEDSRMERR
jgi:hypothetical protein